MEEEHAMADVKKLTDDIRALILHFEAKTGLKVKSIDIDKIPHTTAVTVNVGCSHTLRV